jgi:enoyl-CoA hydratase
VSDSSPVRLEFRDAIAHITIDQPGARANVLSSAMWAALGTAVSEIANHTELDGVVIQSAKDGIFLAGADLKELAALPTDNELPARHVVRNGLCVLAALEALSIPTAAAIDGAALGGGFEVALACDYRLGGNHPKLKLGLPEVKLGLIPGWGGTQRLPRVIGAKHGAELLITGKALGGKDALEYGLIDRIVDGGQLVAEAEDVLHAAPSEDWEARRARKQSAYDGVIELDEVRKLLDILSEDERPAGEAALRVLSSGLPLPLTPAIERESQEFVPLLLSNAGRRRIDAFLQK